MQRLLAALFLLGLATTAHAEARATLDRGSLTTLDNLALTLEVDKRVDQRPDLSPLQQNFRVLGTKRTLISSHSSEGHQVRTRWQVTLRPRKSGELSIPPLMLAGELTQTQKIQVSEPPPQMDGAPGAGIFFDNQINSNRIYKGAQLLYTARLYHRDNLPDGAHIISPVAPHAQIRELGKERLYKGDYRGEPYQITEQQYAIFPEQTGSLLIEGPRLQLPPGNDGSATELQGETLNITVLPPAYKSSLGIWLPAERVTLTDKWHPPANIHPGDRFTRELILTVTGVPADHLPQLTQTNSDDSYIEVQNVSLSESMSPFGLVSTRRETVAIEPLGTGAFTLPPVDLNWWNVKTDRGQHASLPARQFQVTPPPMVDSLIDKPQATVQPASTSLTTLSKSSLLLALLTLTSLISSLGWLYTWYKLRNYRAVNSAEQHEEEIRRQRKLLLANERAERNTFQALAIACQQNSATLAKARLIEWAQNFWPELMMDSLEAICDAARNQTLDFLIIDLEQQLHDNAELWQGDLLLETIDNIRRRRQQSLVPEPTFEPLAQQVS